MKIPVKVYEEVKSGFILEPFVFSYGLNLDGTYESDKFRPTTWIENKGGKTYVVTVV